MKLDYDFPSRLMTLSWKELIAVAVKANVARIPSILSRIEIDFSVYGLFDCSVYVSYITIRRSIRGSSRLCHPILLIERYSSDDSPRRCRGIC